MTSVKSIAKKRFIKYDLLFICYGTGEQPAQENFLRFGGASGDSPNTFGARAPRFDAPYREILYRISQKNTTSFPALHRPKKSQKKEALLPVV